MSEYDLGVEHKYIDTKSINRYANEQAADVCGRVVAAMATAWKTAAGSEAQGWVRARAEAGRAGAG